MKHFTYHFTKRFDLRYCHGFGENNMNVEICRHHRAQDYQSHSETNSTQNQVCVLSGDIIMIMTKMIRAKLCSIKNGSTLVGFRVFCLNCKITWQLPCQTQTQKRTDYALIIEVFLAANDLVDVIVCHIGVFTNLSNNQFTQFFSWKAEE